MSIKPEPVVVSTVCSLCGLPWEAHGDKPTTADCVRLLKVELAKRPVWSPTIVYPVVQPRPYPVYPYRPYWSVGGTTCGITTLNAYINASSTTYRKPEEPPEAISARPAA